jgi:hypothetical protein
MSSEDQLNELKSNSHILSPRSLVYLNDLKSKTVDKTPTRKTIPQRAIINEGKANNKNTLNANVPKAPISFISPLITYK